jgi:hypothetical protein
MDFIALNMQKRRVASEYILVADNMNTLMREEFFAARFRQQD